MTNSDRRGHEHGPARGFEGLNTKSTWSSQFDDIAWDDFNGDDHSVPEPEQSDEPWLCRRKDVKLVAIKAEEGGGGDHTMEEDSSMDVDSWDVAELGTVPDGLIGENGLIELKQESPTLLPDELCLDERVFDEEGGGMVTGSAAHFGYVPAEEEMGLFGGENEVDKGGTLLGYAWESLEDMDNLFQSEESPFAQDAADALMQWPTSTSASPDSAAAVNNAINTASNAKASPELRAMKGKSHEEDMKMEFIPCERFRKGSDVNSEVCANNSEVDRVMDESQAARAEADAAQRENCSSDVPAEGRDQKSSDVMGKAQKRQASHRKRSEDRMRKQIQYSKKLGQAMIQPKQQSLSHYSSAQVKPAVASSLQVYPQVMGAPGMLQRAQYPGPAHHSPYLMQGPQAQHPQPVMVCFEHPEAHQRQQQYEQKLEALAPPPVSGTNMTPQEKIEKLRWKQKMHRLASEQQFAKQCISLDPSAKHKQGKVQHGKRPVVEGDNSLRLCSIGKADEADGRIVEATVLSQLLTIMSKLDVGTRICIRDALYRLAKSAVNRHATDGASSSECSNSSAAEKSISRTFRYPMLETETNPIDRTIANLLFHKRNNTGSMLVVPSQPEWSSWQEAGVSESEETALEKGFTAATGEQSTSEDRESEGSSRKADKSRACDVTTPRSSLKREASSEFLSSQDDRGRGTSSRSDSPRDGKAAKTGIQ